MSLQVKNVTKAFGGKIAIDNISFEMDKPGVFGLLGTNGAGKTTTIRMILGILKCNSGYITWNGKEVERKSVNFGYLPEERGIYPKVKIHEQLIYLAKLKGMKKSEAEKSLSYWAKRLGVEQYINMPAEKLSKGNQQKVQFITAVIHNPELLILDEPFSGLDPINTEMLKQVITELVKRGTYIIMSSHQMDSIEDFCTDILILDKGKTVIQGNLDEIKSSYNINKIDIITRQNIDSEIKGTGLKIIRQAGTHYEIEMQNEMDSQILLKNLINNGVMIEKMEIIKPSLNDIFIERVKGEK